MRRKSVAFVAASLASLLIVGVAAVVLAQGSGSSRATPTPPKQPTVDEFATSLWQFINRDKASWRKWAATTGPPVEGVDSPHGASGKIYFNEAAATGWKQPPYGAIVLREEFDDDGKTLRGISMMYRVKGTAPKTNDWYWLSFQPNGKLNRTPVEEGNKPIAGQVANCIACHRQTRGNDFVFSNEAAPAPAAEK